MTPMQTDRQRLLETGAIFLTGLGKFIFMDWLDLRFAFIATAVIGWGAYVYWRYRQQPDILAHWGFSRKNSRRTLQTLWPLALLSILAFALIGWQRGTIIIGWQIIPILLLYPIWGVIQQFLIVSLIAGNLKDQQQFSISDTWIILITALVFALVHYPYWWLIGGTFLLALLYAYLFLRDRHLWWLGVFHGWLGAFFFYFVMDRDPFFEVFGPLLSVQ